MKPIAAALLVCAIALTGCSNMSPTEQRAVSGTAIGAAGGAVIGAIAGNAGLGAVIGAGAGLAGGLIYDQVKKNEQSSYNQGYAAGKHSAQTSQ
jgi:uncharacterized protein YcfJ